MVLSIELQPVTSGIVTVENLLLGALGPEEFEVLRPDLQPVELKKGEILVDSNRPTEAVHFIESGIVSIMTRSHLEGGLEVAMVGKGGLVGLAAVLGATTSNHRACVQIGGRALRIRSADLVRALVEQPNIRLLVLRYVQSFIAQMSQTAFCNAKHHAEEKIARWLLLAEEYAGEDDLTVTHELLGILLNARRAGVTVALCRLESHGLLSRTRGVIRIRDRERLADRSCPCRRMIVQSSAWLDPEKRHRHHLVCSSSDNLRPIRHFENGGSGSSEFRV